MGRLMAKNQNIKCVIANPGSRMKQSPSGIPAIPMIPVSDSEYPDYEKTLDMVERFTNRFKRISDIKAKIILFTKEDVADELIARTGAVSYYFQTGNQS